MFFTSQGAFGTPMQKLVVFGLLMIVGFVGPESILNRRIDERRKDMEKSLPRRHRPARDQCRGRTRLRGGHGKGHASGPWRALPGGGLAWTVAVLVITIGIVAVVRPGDTFDEERFPSDQLMAVVETDRFFHDDAVGGYLIYRDWPTEPGLHRRPGRAVRSRVLPGASGCESGGGTRELFAEYDMTEAIVKPAWGLALQLERDGWFVVGEDDFFLVMRAPAG